MFKVIFKVIVVFLLCMKASASELEGNSAVPRKFKISEWGVGFAVEGYQLEFKNDRLVLTQYEPGKRKHRQRVITPPSATKWRDFWRTLDELEVWKWKEEYAWSSKDSVIYDGAAWAIEIEKKGRKVVSGGRNAYPSIRNSRKVENSLSETDNRFYRLRKAVLELTGLSSMWASPE